MSSRLEPIMLLTFVVVTMAQKIELLDTKYGPIKGISYGGDNPIREFHQVPYGSAGRWENPKEPKSWTDPLDCTGAASGTGFSVGCSQVCGLPAVACPNVTQEDCLFLNVFSQKKSSSPLPVILFIHGGNFKMGFGDGALYNGSALARRNNIVVVTINYRLGSLGFLSSGDGDITGNYGFLDQQAAIRWTHENIGVFGGDQNDITIFGQSAGGQSASLHSVVPETKNWGVKRILAESNPFGLPLRTEKTWKGIYKSLLSKTNCKDASCLRQLPVDEVLKGQADAETDIIHELSSLLNLFEPWTPTVGGKLFPDQILTLYQQGKVNPIPIINGVVSEDGRMFVYEALTSTVPPIEYKALIVALFGTSAGSKIIEQYPIPAGVKDARNIASIAVTDGIFHCPNLAASLSTAQNSTWFYEFDHVMSFYGNGSFGGFSPDCEGHVCHQEELVFVFYPSPEKILEEVGSTYTADERLLGHRMNSYWGQYAKLGNPGSGDPSQALKWPPMGSNATMMEFRIKDTIRANAYKKKCTFWDNLGYPWLK